MTLEELKQEFREALAEKKQALQLLNETPYTEGMLNYECAYDAYKRCSARLHGVAMSIVMELYKEEGEENGG